MLAKKTKRYGLVRSNFLQQFYVEDSSKGSWPDLLLNGERGFNIHMLLVIYLICLFFFTLMPFTFSLNTTVSVSNLYEEIFDIRTVFLNITAWDVISNILLFVPFGFLFVSLPALSQHGGITKLFLSGVVACALSLSIEIGQLFLPRYPSLEDFLFNVVGGLAGALIAIYAYSPLSRTAHRWCLNLQRTPMLSLLLIAYSAGLLATYSVPLPSRPDFSNWDPAFPLQLGNETTLDRPWLGSIFLFAIYDRVLTQDEIVNHLKDGAFSDSPQNRVTEGLVAFYDFTEGSGPIVHDRSSFGLPLDLRIRERQNIKWLRPNGIKFLRNTIIAHSEPAKKLYNNAMNHRDTLTMEAWIAPAHIHQEGPARIVSYSRGPKLRNFTLGQVEQNIVFRLRTPISGLNGTRPQLKTRDNPLNTGLQHLVITYRKGLEILYVNGQQHDTLVLDQKRYLMDVFEEFFGWKYMWAYWFLVLFPVGFLSHILFSRNKKHSGKAFYLSVFIGLTVLGATEGLQVIIQQRGFDRSLLPIGTGIILLSILTSVVLSRNPQSS